MDLKPAITKLFTLYQQLNTYKNVQPGFGFVFERYKTSTNKHGLLIVVLSPPTRRAKGKKKNYDKVIEKSADKNRLIKPGDFDDIRNYLNQNFSSLIHPKDEIQEKIQMVIAGMRLSFIPIHNVKYSFGDPNNPQIMIYENIDQAQFYFYINILDLKEDGLFLAHEKQIKHIKNEIQRGNNPNYIQDLPPLRTGDTEIDFNKKHPVEEESNALKAFREKIEQKKIKEEIDNELAFETVIDFKKETRSKMANSSDQQEIQMSPFGKPVIVSKQPNNSTQSSPNTDLSENSELESSNNTIQHTPPRNLPKPPPMPLPTEESLEQTSPPSDQVTSSSKLKKKQTAKLKHSAPSKMEDSAKFNQIQQLEEQLRLVTDNLTRQLEEKDKIISKLKIKLKGQRIKQDREGENNEEFQKIREEMQQKLASYERIIKSLEEERKAFKNQSAHHSAPPQQSNNRIEKLEGQLLSIQTENKLLAKAIKETDIKNQQLEANLHHFKQENQSLMEEKINLELILTELQEEIKNIKVEFENIGKRANTQNMKEQNIPLKSSLNQIKSHIDDIVLEKEDELNDLTKKKENH